MKKFLCFSVFAILVVFKSYSYDQNDLNDKEVVMFLKQFYSEYITSVSEDEPIISVKKTNALQRKYCTKQLLRRIPVLANKIDADPFLSAQDSNQDCLKTLSIKRHPKIKNQYIVSYVDIYSNTKFIVYLTIIKNNNTYQISDIHW
ncbi:MAG: DUF3828 domain-containing protein [Bacteroidales bacterium]